VPAACYRELVLNKLAVPRQDDFTPEKVLKAYLAMLDEILVRVSRVPIVIYDLNLPSCGNGAFRLPIIE
jgi:hypothetical protein